MSSEQIQVVVRFRKSKATESPDPSVHVVNTSEVSALNPTSNEYTSGAGKRFTYDRVFAQDASQSDVYEEIGRPTVDNVVRGYNGTVLAYGQTGSGKTHSMMGPGGGDAEALTPSSPLYPQRGLIPRIVEAIFADLDAKDREEVSYTVQVGVFELYMEGINDLLLPPSTSASGKLEYKIREDNLSGKGIYVENLILRDCKSVDDVYDAMRCGIASRKVAATMANDTSSRSHCLTCLLVTQVDHTHEDARTTSRLNLVDLAGSEKVAKTQAEGQRLKEAQMINLSLTLLGNVIYKLTDGKSLYIPYRDSKLTRILQESFGGNSRTTLLCTCSNSASHKEETMSTLAFAARAKLIQNKPRVNRELSPKELQVAYLRLLEENKCLQERIQFLEGCATSVGAGAPGVLPSTTQHGVSPVVGEPATWAAKEAEYTSERNALLEQVASLQRAVTQLREETLDKDSAVRDATQRLEFHKKKAKESDATLQDMKEKLKREQQACASWVRKYNEASLAITAAKGAPSNGTPPLASTVQRKSSIPRGRTNSGAGRRRSSQATTPDVPSDDNKNTSSLSNTSTTTTMSADVVNVAPVDVGPTREEHDALAQKLAHALQHVEETSIALRESQSGNTRLNYEMEVLRTKHDEVERDRDAMRKRASNLDVEVAELKDKISDLMARLSHSEKNDAHKAQELDQRRNEISGIAQERDRLHELSKQLQQQRAQLEFCEVAELELMVKGEDIDVTENDIVLLETGVLDGVRKESTLFECLHTLHRLQHFFQAVLSSLRKQPFSTPDTESRRARLIDGFSQSLVRIETGQNKIARLAQDL